MDSPTNAGGYLEYVDLEIVDQAQIDNVLILHRWALEHRVEAGQMNDGPHRHLISLNLTYQLSGRGTMSRSYRLEIDPADMDREGSAVWALEQLYADRDLHWKAYGFDEIHSILENNGRLQAAYYDVTDTKATARVKSFTTDGTTTCSLYWDCPDLRYVAELVTREGVVMEDNGVPMGYTTVSEALSHVGKTQDTVSGETSYIVRLISQSQYWQTGAITSNHDWPIREAYIDFREVGDLTTTDSFVYLDLNGQMLITQGLIIPDNVKVTGLDSSGKLKNSATEGRPSGKLMVASSANSNSTTDKYAGIYTMAEGQDPTKNTNGKLNFTAAKSSGFDLNLDNFYPTYVGQCLPVMLTDNHNLAIGYQNQSKVDPGLEFGN